MKCPLFDREWSSSLAVYCLDSACVTVLGNFDSLQMDSETDCTDTCYLCPCDVLLKFVPLNMMQKREVLHKEGMSFFVII